MSPFVTESLEIDADAVKRAAIKMARQNFAFQAKRLGDYGLCSPYVEHLGNALRWHKTKAAFDLELEVERARRRELTDAQREREDLIAWRDRIGNPLICPAYLMLDGAALSREIARVNARLAEIDGPALHEVAA